VGRDGQRSPPGRNPELKSNFSNVSTLQIGGGLWALHHSPHSSARLFPQGHVLVICENTEKEDQWYRNMRDKYVTWALCRRLS
jgi:hypothetical protein